MKWLAASVLVLMACGAPQVVTPDAGAWDWRLPTGFPTPRVPADNPMSAAKVELGRRLFYDVKLSLNQTQSCGSCHLQSKAFTDGRATAKGSTGQVHRRNSQTLVNIAFSTSLTWANPLVTSLETQALLPLFGETPVELGFGGREDELVARFANDPAEVKRFEAAFPGEKVSVASITRALAAFQRSLISGRAPYDRYLYDADIDALSASAKRGRDLFLSEKLECDHCHAGFNFSDAVAHDGTVMPEQIFHNTGLYDVDGLGAYPAADTGLLEITLKPEHMGRFRAPTLRNIAVTGPYMHDGSIATLSEVVDHYAHGGRARKEASKQNPFQSEFVRGFTLTAQEKADLLAFLESLTDTAFLSDPAHADPFR